MSDQEIDPKSQLTPGNRYSRADVGDVYYPGQGRPKGGMWDSGYVREKNDLLIFMNVGIPGGTGHDFKNNYESESGIVNWYGKPRTHSGQPIFKMIIGGEITPVVFARWAPKDKFTYLGEGKFLSFRDGEKGKRPDGSSVDTIKVVLKCNKYLTTPPPPFEELETRVSELWTTATEIPHDFVCSSEIPVRQKYEASRYKREPKVVLKVEKEANGVCELCREAAPFKRTDGRPYLEVHHIVPLSEQSSNEMNLDRVDNCVALCPNCHRKAHHSEKIEALRHELTLIAQKRSIKNLG